MQTSNGVFAFSQTSEPHQRRTREILERHPEIRQLTGRNPWTFLFLLGIVALQLTLAIVLRESSWWLILAVAYVVGAFANHALFVMIHECAHNLIFKKKIPNKLAAMVADIPHTFPGSVGFRRYHLKHHAFQGVYELDADLPSRWEARLVGRSAIGKALWLLFFPVFQMLRPPRLREIKMTCGWTWFNMAVILLSDALIIYFFGFKAFAYLVLSFVFAIGLHPLGARWIQEHYVVSPPQETYSYYGPLNLLSFNVGYHNEHHDFPSVPWNRLPQIRKLAPEYYDTLVYHTSWVRLLFRFLLDKNITLFSRVVRSDRGGVPVLADV